MGFRLTTRTCGKAERLFLEAADQTIEHVRVFSFLSFLFSISFEYDSVDPENTTQGGNKEPFQPS